MSWGGTSAWQRLNSSSVDPSKLAVADFSADGRTDVFYANGQRWSGTSRWSLLNGDGRTDVLSRLSPNQALPRFAPTAYSPSKIR